ncbi:MAG: hypothetical protein VX000_10615, partial [Myxococcota bacterium]|nr:hypothetical protein [Myxococcota bacterium]
LWLLARPSSGRALLSASLLAFTSFFYWYYGFFGVLFGGVMVLVHGWRTLGIRVLVVFVASFSAMIGPWLGLFISRWADIPGTDELAVFPPMQALGDAAALTWPWSVGGGRAEGTAVPLPLLLLGGLGAVGGLLRGAGQRRHNLGLVLAFLLFAGLSVGPAFPGAPYTILYGLAEPLRRYWWPLRHVVLAVPLVGVLAALALTLLRARVSRAWPTRLGVVFPAVLAVGLACATPALLAAQGAPTRVPLTAMRLPPPVYPELATRSPGVLLEPPLSPELSGTQHHLLLQRWHGHALLTGHAPWVERVRPPAWDRFIEENSFLSALQALERGELGDGPLSFDPLDLTSLRQAGLQTVTVNRAALPLKARPLVEAYVVLFDGLFGPAIARAPGIWAWDVDGWDGETSTVVLPSWSWPDALRRGGPEAPLVARRPRSQIFEREPLP